MLPSPYFAHALAVGVVNGVVVAPGVAPVVTIATDAITFVVIVVIDDHDIDDGD